MFPLIDKYPAEFTPVSITSWIKKQLIYVRDVIQPRLSKRGAAEHREHPRAVSREQLSYLWQHRKSKAIDIILNNSTFPSPPPTVNDTSDVYKHYFAKCRSPPSEPVTPPPWANSIESVAPQLTSLLMKLCPSCQTTQLVDMMG